MATKSDSSAKKNTAAAGIFSAFPMAFMTELPGLPTNVSASWWQAYMSGAAEMNKEFMSFVARRLQQDAELGQALAQCSDWAAAASVQEEWIRKMSKEYAAEAETLMQIASKTAQQSGPGGQQASKSDKK